MNKAFIFDMDGVIIASERPWHKYLNEIWGNLVGAEVAAKYKIPIGKTPKEIYEGAINNGSTVTWESFIRTFDSIAEKVYRESPITEGVNELGNQLILSDYKIGLVSSSRKPWIETVLKRLTFGKNIDYVLSVNDRKDLLPKPSPDSYIEAMRQLNSNSANTVIIEDTNTGIRAAKNAGAYVIGFTPHLHEGYIQEGADVYAHTMEQVMDVMKKMDMVVSPLHRTSSNA